MEDGKDNAALAAKVAKVVSVNGKLKVEVDGKCDDLSARAGEEVKWEGSKYDLKFRFTEGMFTSARHEYPTPRLPSKTNPTLSSNQRALVMKLAADLPYAAYEYDLFADGDPVEGPVDGARPRIKISSGTLGEGE